MKKDVQFHERDGSCRSVNFEVSDASRAMLSVVKGADSAAMTSFKLHGGRKIIKDATASQKKKHPGFRHCLREWCIPPVCDDVKKQ